MTLVVNQLNNLHLDCLDHGWVTAIFHSEFLEFCDLPPEYENNLESYDLRSTLEDIIKSTDRWLTSETESNEDKSWAMLSIHIEHKKVLAILGYYINHGCKNILIKEYRNIALLASRVYYKLLSIPGYKAYHIYHSQLFALSLACLSFPKAMCEDDSHFNTKELTREVNSVIKELRHFVIDLRAIIETLHLSPNDMNFEDILSNLVDITGGAIVNKLHVDKIELTSISGVIYEIIDILLCNTNREPNSVAIRSLFKCILPKLISSSLDNRNANNLVRASYVTYSGLLLSKYGKDALSGYIILLEHLCYTLDGLERAEVRMARVSLVVGLMSLLPRKSYKSIVKWLLHLSTTAKISHRQIAMEILATLLSNEPEVTKPPIPAQANENDASTHEGANSENNGQVSDSQPNISQLNGEQMTGDNPNESQQNFTLATDDESSQDSQPSAVVDQLEPDMSEEDIAGILRQRPHTVLHAEILRTVFDRVDDESSTLRTRAIAILTECLTSKRPAMINAIKELSGSGSVSRLTAVGARSVCDERASVRRAGVALLLRLLAHPAAPAPKAADLAILVTLCRDGSILVRMSAIAAVSELVTLRPSEAVVDAFLMGPMQQLSDPENKVQEQVLTFIQNLFINHLHKFTVPGCDDPLPWLFLESITRQKMKKHLQKACFKLSKTANCINHRLVDILSTHLGALDDVRDLQCLVLLTSVARHVDYSDIAFVIDYYYKLTDNEEGRDVRLLALTLELMMSWSRFAQAPQRSALRDHLVRRLTAARDDGCRIPTAALAKQLDPDNLTWASELMQLAESRALEGGQLAEANRAADLSLVAPDPPSPALLTLLINAINEPQPEWEVGVVGALVAGAGRLCLRARAAAAAAAPALAALLARAAAPLPARANAVLALSDICIRYTCIVEPLLGTVCGCLSPQSPAQLRRAAARALTRLLLGGFLRLRTPLYYRYCALLADDDHDVREPAEYYVTSCLTADTIYHHFVECVIYYNQDGGDLTNFDARQLIYDVMLQRMSLVQKLNIQCRLAREVLEHAADLTDEGDEELPPAMNAALLDTITLLRGPRMKLPKKPQTTGDTHDIDDLQERVTTNIVSHKMKCTVAEVLVPAVLRLYSRLSPRGGQIATYLVHIATDLLNDYQPELREVMNDNEDLIKRIQHFQETIGVETTFGNVRNLVTTTAPPEPETPRARRRPRAPRPHSPRKRALRI